jgi:hypothetical protein
LSFSGRNSLPEQVASILSFLTHVGAPISFTVLSDGTYSAEDCEKLCRLHSSVRVMMPEDLLETKLPVYVQQYVATGQPMGLKLAALIKLSQDPPAFYTDSDVLFFPGARKALSKLLLSKTSAFFTKDCVAALDPRLLNANEALFAPVNAGFIFFNGCPDWSLAISRLEHAVTSPTFFTEQTVVHLTMHQNKAVALDPSEFILQVDDQFKIRDKYAKSNTALRHYVSPVRHKLWLQTIEELES